MDFTSIRGEEIPYYSKKATWNILHEYIDVHSKRVIDEFQGYGVKAIKILQSQCAIMTFAE